MTTVDSRLETAAASIHRGDRKLFFADSLDVLREMDGAVIDLIYLDPPFNSNRIHNVIFRSPQGAFSDAQLAAFRDTWAWGQQAEREYAEIMSSTTAELGEMTRSFRNFLGESDMMAYLVMIGRRAYEMHRVLKSTGSLYLHCDPTASHYIKVLLDVIFGGDRYVNEIIWRRHGAHNARRQFGPIHDVIHVYAKSSAYKFNIVRRPYMRGHVERRYGPAANDGRRRFTSGGNVLTGQGKSDGDSGRAWRGFDPSPKDRHWAVPSIYESQMPESYKNLSTTEKLEALFQAGLIEITPGNAWPTMVRYLDERDGVSLQDLWTYQPYTERTVYGTEDGIDADVQWHGPTDQDKLGYPTEKPIGLLERIIKSSTDEGDLVMDPFCGTGTTLHAAERLHRSWVGIDISHYAIAKVENRLHADDPEMKIETFGAPTTFDGAVELARRDKHNFQMWALTLVNAQAYRGGKRGADGGVDGIVFFNDVVDGKVSTRKAIVSVKGGEHVGLDMIKHLQQTVKDNDADIGLFVTLSVPTGPMKNQALKAGFFRAGTGQEFARTQILPVEQLLAGNLQPQVPNIMSIGGIGAFRTTRRPRESAIQQRLV